MNKRAIRIFTSKLAEAFGLLTLTESFLNNHLIVLTYHRVLPESLIKSYLFPSLAVSESIFLRQIKYLKENFDIVRLDKALNRMRTENSHKRPMVAITFDDGYTDNWKFAAPILDSFSVKATFFIVSNLIGSKKALWHDVAALCWKNLDARSINNAAPQNSRLPNWSKNTKPSFPMWMAYLKSLDHESRKLTLNSLIDSGHDEGQNDLDYIMSAHQLRSLSDRGHQIGSHTCSHPLLPQLSNGELERELVNSKTVIEAMLNMRVDAFCYPNGDYDERVVEAVKRAGYTSSCTTKNTSNTQGVNPFKIGRINMNMNSCLDLRNEFHEPSFRLMINPTRSVDRLQWLSRKHSALRSQY